LSKSKAAEISKSDFVAVYNSLFDFGEEIINDAVDDWYFESSQGYSNKVSKHTPIEDKIIRIADYEF